MASLTFHSPDQMLNWGRKLARLLKLRDVVALVGELGAGKTTLVQGISAGWGYRRGATSPTFALANEYRTVRGTIYHLDMYRLSKRELASFPLEEYWGQGLCLIEWADRVRDRWPAETLEVQLKILTPTTRSLTVIPAKAGIHKCIRRPRLPPG